MALSNIYLVIFAVAMTGCVLATPWVTRVANWVGAIDRPDQFRRIHSGAIPRLGGLGLAFGVAAGLLLPGLVESLRIRTAGLYGWPEYGPLLTAAVIILIVGFLDDTRSLGPRVKLLGQAAAVLALYLGGIRIESIDVLDLTVELGYPSVGFAVFGYPVSLAIPSLLVTLFWFLGCMNVWNLIDGMDGLASGVGLLVSGTLTLVAIHNENFGVAVLAVALAGSLAGFLLFNWHPACIFLGDSGSLLIGLLIGVIGVQGSLKGPSAISILFPILAMGLPISDTAMAIFRRWVRNLPLSAADRRHVHHLLIGLGLTPRQAALMLYSFSGFLCGAVMLGVALRSEYLALVLGLSGCLAFLLVVTSRRDELTSLRGDLLERFMRGRQERSAAQKTWEAIQRIECCASAMVAFEIMETTARALGCDRMRISFARADSPVASPCLDLLESEPPNLEAERAAGSSDAATDPEAGASSRSKPGVSAASAVFRLSGGRGLWITVSLDLSPGSDIVPDIVFRYLQRLTQTLSDRLETLAEGEHEPAPAAIGSVEACSESTAEPERARRTSESFSSEVESPPERKVGSGSTASPLVLVPRISRLLARAAWARAGGVAFDTGSSSHRESLTGPPSLVRR
jgi:UDP-GlcNAc:undecaprenyl-phosphate GlcNAc-1-phosphate transferase